MNQPAAHHAARAGASRSPGGYFVTGTDTGVGKTVVAAILTLGLEATYWKPVQSGIVRSSQARPREAPTDTAAVARWTGLPRDRFWPEAYRLRWPASPHLSAAREGVRIQTSRFHLPPSPRPIIVEGAGGILVPLNGRQLMVDLMVRLGLPVILVARSSLGTINHTLLSLEALGARHLQVAGVVLNGPPDAANAAAIRHYGRTRVLAALPPLPGLTPAQLRAAWRRCFAAGKMLPSVAAAPGGPMSGAGVPRRASAAAERKIRACNGGDF